MTMPAYASMDLISSSVHIFQTLCICWYGVVDKLLPLFSEVPSSIPGSISLSETNKPMPYLLRHCKPEPLQVEP